MIGLYDSKVHVHVKYESGQVIQTTTDYPRL